MPQVQILAQEQVEQFFSKESPRKVREEELAPYREAMSQVNDEYVGGIIELTEGDDFKKVRHYMKIAAREAGKPIRFKRSNDTSQLIFRLQTPEERERLVQRGAALAASRYRQDVDEGDIIDQIVTRPAPKPAGKKK